MLHFICLISTATTSNVKMNGDLFCKMSNYSCSALVVYTREIRLICSDKYKFHDPQMKNLNWQMWGTYCNVNLRIYDHHDSFTNYHINIWKDCFYLFLILRLISLWWLHVHGFNAYITHKSLRYSTYNHTESSVLEEHLPLFNFFIF